MQAREARYLGSCSLAQLQVWAAKTFPKLTVDASGEIIAMPLSFDGMTVIFQHLFQNAAEHSASQIKLAATETVDEIRIDIRDNGTGISAGNADRIFNAFFTTKRESGGTGMELAIAGNIIAAHNGKIKCVPKKAGAFFQIIFPK